jgi:hypothetical protein
MASEQSAKEPPDGNSVDERSEEALRQAALEGLSLEQLQERIDDLEEQIELEEQRRELDRKLVNLELLKLANRAPRCNYMKLNGTPCRAPAMAGCLYCYYHLRALEQANGSGVRIHVIEDRRTAQLAVKQIMEQVASGRMNGQTGSVMLREYKSPRPRSRAARPML